MSTSSLLCVTLKHRRVLPRAALAAALTAVPALAGPPLLTDDPDPVEKGAFELNTTYRLTVSARDGELGRTWEHEAPLFDLAYGLFEGVHVKCEMPVSVLDPAGGESARGGIGDASIGSKIRFLKDDEWPVSVSIFPAVGVPLGSSSRGLGTGSPSLTLPVEIGRHLLDDTLFVYADGGYEEQFARAEPDLWFTGLAAEYEAVKGLVLVGEVRFEFGVRGAADDSLFNVGVKWKLSDHSAFIGAIGRSFDPSADSGADLRLNVGVQWSF